MYVQDTTAGTTTTGSFFYERDHLGSIREMTDANQTIRAAVSARTSVPIRTAFP
jgi:hypothetical protein